MGLISSIRKLFKAKDWRKWFLRSVSMPAYGEQIQPGDFYDMYQNVLWAFLGISVTAQAAAQIPIKLYAKTDKGHKVPIAKHPLLELLDNPNSIDTQFTLFWRTYSYLLIAGNAFWRLDQAEKPSKIEVIRPDRVRIVLKDDKRKYYIRQNDQGDEEEVPDSEIVQFMTFNPKTPLIGIGNMTPLKDSAIIDLYLIKYDRTYYENAINPRGYVRLPDGVVVDDRTYDRLKTELQAFHQGVEKFHGVPLLEAGAEYVELKNPTHADTDFIRHKRLTREEILAGFGCWPLVALLRESANKSTLQEAYRMFYDLTVMPMVENVRQLLQKEFVPRYPMHEMLEIKFAYQLLKSLRSDLLDISQAAYRFVTLGIMTPNMVLTELLGLDPVPWGDQPPKTALFQMPVTMFEPNEEKEIMEPRERPQSVEENWLTASGAEEELRRLMSEANRLKRVK